MTMPSLWSFLHTSTVELLGWTLVHFVWQGALVAAVLVGALRLLRTHSPRVRYAVSGVALLGLLALPIGTGMVLSGSVLTSSAPTVVVGDGSGAAEASQVVVVEPAAATTVSWQAWATSWVQPVLPWMVLAWGVGVVGFAFRLGGGAWRMRRVRRSSTPAPSEWRDRLRALAAQMGVKAEVALRHSDRVDGPVLARWWRPVILVPAGFLSGLPPAQVEALLLHELAHVRRHDVLVGRLQAVVETLLFFHPATWWISAQVRQAREACCDDLVLQAGSGRKTYAQALTALAEHAVEGRSLTGVPAATDGSLLSRIQRLVSPAEAPHTAGRRLSIVVAALLMVVVPVGLAACASQQSATQVDTSAPAVQTEESRKESGERETSSVPEAPGTEERETTVVIRGDSTERNVVVDSDGPVVADSVEKDLFVVRKGGHVDTFEVTGPEGFEPPLSPLFPPDSLEQALRKQLNPDSLERMIQARINPDSLERVIRTRISTDSIERAVRMRFDADSLERQARRMAFTVDSLARRSAERFANTFPDSTFAFEFDREDFDVELNVDSVRHWHEERADSLHRHFEKMRERLEGRRSEHLREEARRLRERAERLEERAEEMEEEAPEPPADPQGGRSEPGNRH